MPSTSSLPPIPASSAGLPVLSGRGLFGASAASALTSGFGIPSSFFGATAAFAPLSGSPFVLPAQGTESLPSATCVTGSVQQPPGTLMLSGTQPTSAITQSIAAAQVQQTQTPSALGALLSVPSATTTTAATPSLFGAAPSLTSAQLSSAALGGGVGGAGAGGLFASLGLGAHASFGASAIAKPGASGGLPQIAPLSAVPTATPAAERALFPAPGAAGTKAPSTFGIAPVGIAATQPAVSASTQAAGPLAGPFGLTGTMAGAAAPQLQVAHALQVGQMAPQLSGFLSATAIASPPKSLVPQAPASAASQQLSQAGGDFPLSRPPGSLTGDSLALTQPQQMPSSLAVPKSAQQQQQQQQQQQALAAAALASARESSHTTAAVPPPSAAGPSASAEGVSGSGEASEKFSLELREFCESVRSMVSFPGVTLGGSAALDAAIPSKDVVEMRNRYTLLHLLLKHLFPIASFCCN